MKKYNICGGDDKNLFRLSDEEIEFLRGAKAGFGVLKNPYDPHTEERYELMPQSDKNKKNIAEFKADITVNHNLDEIEEQLDRILEKAEKVKNILQ